MPSYDVTVYVSGLVSWFMEADTPEAAEQEARETWEMHQGDFQCGEVDDVVVELDEP